MASREGVEFVESYHIMENGNLVLNLKQELKNKNHSLKCCKLK